MHIRQITQDDALDFLELNHQLDSETQLMLLEPGERTTTVEQIQHRIECTLQEDNEMVFVAEVALETWLGMPVLLVEDYDALRTERLS